MKTIVILFSLFISTIANAQSLTKPLWDNLCTRMAKFVYEQFPECTVSKASELAYILLETDSTGAVSDLHVKGDARDSIYQFLNRMPVKVFEGWQSNSCRNKIIMIPYFYWFFEGENSYAYRIYKDYYGAISRDQISKENGNTIMTRGMVSFAPVTLETSCGGTPFAIITDTLHSKLPPVRKAN